MTGSLEVGRTGDWATHSAAHGCGASSLMIAVVIVSGNHYVLDVAGSAVLLAVSLAAATALGRLKALPSKRA